MNAKELLQSSIVIDTHLDLLCDVVPKRRAGRTHVLRDDYLESFRAGGVTCVVSSLFNDIEGSLLDPLTDAMTQIGALYAELSECGDDFFLALNAADIRRAKEEHKVAVMLAFEGAEPMAGNVELLRVFYRLGVRVLGLCWSRSNWAADGCKFAGKGYIGYDITSDGKRLIALARELGMLIDLSHTNELGFWSVIKGAFPVIESHTNTRALADIPRNLSDKQLEAVARSGGVIGINGYSLLAAKDPAAATMDTLIAHMVHEKKLIGAGSLCLGLDQCDRIHSYANEEEKKTRFDIIPSHAMLGEFVTRMGAAGFTEDEIRGILGANA
ncbi:MAG: dipeptidase, partial [Spirochaetaceae bacterium]|nr:dipeptidase [Spirochaetaceae bacterium]